MKKCLFVLGGLSIGGVETYIIRLAKELSKRGICVDVLLLSKKFNTKLMVDLKKNANVIVSDRVPFFGASSWVNGFLPVDSSIKNNVYDIVHVVDLLTLGYVYLNRQSFSFHALSIGVYHENEIVWWRGRNVYFRKKILEIYDRNFKLNVFANEVIAKSAAIYVGADSKDFSVVPLGVDLTRFLNVMPSYKSKKIISIGRLVDFKTYNKNTILELNKIREYGNFEYHIYGTGPEMIELRQIAEKHGVIQYVYFHGNIEYENIPAILNDCFCFIGSGTTLIEASAAGVPSIIGIESIVDPFTSGLFCDVVGYSYHEPSATSRRVFISEVVASLIHMSEEQYKNISDAHRLKASEFDITITTDLFIKQSIYELEHSISYNRWRALLSFFFSIVRYGPSALKSRFQS